MYKMTDEQKIKHYHEILVFMDNWAKYMHPYYGPCDSIADGKCAECVSIIERLQYLASNHTE